MTALLIGAGTALATPLAFAHLARSTPPERLGHTIGAARSRPRTRRCRRPLLVGVAAVAVSLGGGLAMLALAVTLTALLAARPPAHHDPSEQTR
jgi:hypothetical protein